MGRPRGSTAKPKSSAVPITCCCRKHGIPEPEGDKGRWFDAGCKIHGVVARVPEDDFLGQEKPHGWLGQRNWFVSIGSK